MSFKKQQPYQPDMFKVPLLPSRSEKYLYDPKASHNLFYHNVYCKIPEDIFTPLYCTGNGRPNANVRLLVAMRIFKEGGGYSDQEMFEAKAASLAGFGLLERVFGEQYRTNADTGSLEAIPKAKRWLRNNVEATIFQLTFHTRNNKTRYRGLMKQKIFALSRCLWVNCVRLSLFEARMAE